MEFNTLRIEPRTKLEISLTWLSAETARYRLAVQTGVAPAISETDERRLRKRINEAAYELRRLRETSMEADSVYE